MTIRMKGPVLATIVGFSAIIFIIAGLMIGWKWVAPATEEEEPAAIEEVVTDAGQVVYSDLIEQIESIPEIESWYLRFNEYYDVGVGRYTLHLDIGDTEVAFDRAFLSDFKNDIDKFVESFAE